MEFWRYKDKAILDKRELKRFNAKDHQPPKLCIATKDFLGYISLSIKPLINKSRCM